MDENSWLGANRKILENELIMKQHMLANIEDLDRCCEKAGVTVTVEVKAGLHPKMIVVEEAKKHGAYHVILDRYLLNPSPRPRSILPKSCSKTL